MPSVVNTLGDRTHFFYSCAGTTIENPQTITLWRKKSKFAKILGHQKGSTFGSVYNVFTSAPSPYGEILGHQKGSTFGSVDTLFASAPSPYGEILGHQKGSTFGSVDTEPKVDPF